MCFSVVAFVKLLDVLNKANCFNTVKKKSEQKGLDWKRRGLLEIIVTPTGRSRCSLCTPDCKSLGLQKTFEKKENSPAEQFVDGKFQQDQKHLQKMFKIYKT